MHNMKVQMKKLLKNNLNVIIAFALGIFLTGITVYAATLILLVVM